MNKLLIGAFIIAVSFSISSTGARADCGEVSIGAMGWSSGKTIAAVATFVLEQGYGCTVVVMPTDTEPSITSIDENGQPDIIIEVWKNSAPLYDRLENEQKLITASNVFKNGGEEGWWIPTKLVEKYPKLRTIIGVLANPELVGSRFHNCPVGWGCRIVNDNLKIVHQLEANGIEIFDHKSVADLNATIDDAFANDDPWFGYYWGPSRMLGKYEMTMVDIGDVDTEQHAINQSPDTPEEKLAPSGFPSVSVLNVVKVDLAKKEPEAFKFVQNISFQNDIISKMLAWKEANNASVEQAAAWILTNHKNVILDWVNEDAKVKLNNLL